MSDDKRKGEKPIPDDVIKHLNDAQQAELQTIQGFGWSLMFIRRPLFQERVAVVTSPDGSSIGILEEDGRLNLEPNIIVRDPTTMD
jgi:hypothetical protein